MQVTSIEQSKRLVELGLDKSTADMRYGYIAPYDYSDRMFEGGFDEVSYHKDFLKKNPNFSENEYDGELPAWSLSRLLELMPISYQMSRSRDGKIQLMLIAVLRKDYYENELEAAYSMICWLLENDLFDAEKLKNYVPTTHCCFCGKEIKEREVHNAQPVKDGVCCLSCNNTIVGPERMKLAKKYGTQH